jgi:DNA gyrase subunit A
MSHPIPHSHGISLEQELKQSYLDYAMSVIVGRALPDVRDGLKPVHRRVLYAMYELGNDYNKPYKKSARIVGDVIGKYHPHGDTAVYDTIVRMAQPFSMRYVLIDGQGNFGSVDGDNAAAMRYTEIRMAKLAHSLLADLDKETVDFVPNYDGSEFAPSVLPTRIPNLLINGSAGIAVGMATNIPPHNLTEVINATIALIDNADLTIDDLMQYIPGPDFPTAGIINGRAGIIEAYRNGKGRVVMRAKTHVEGDEDSKQSIIVTELPYQVNKAKLMEKIAELVKLKKIEGITGLRDESDKDGMRMVIELKRGELPEVIINNLYIQTPMQSVFGINFVALDHQEPKLFNLKEMLEAFIRHRQDVVTRRTLFELKKSRERGHILEGLGIALSNLDRMIETIKKSPTPQIAKEALMNTEWQAGVVAAMIEKSGDHKVYRPEGLPSIFGLQGTTYRLSAEQAQAILELRLNRLTGLEQEKIFEEYGQVLLTIQGLLAILGSYQKLMDVIKNELLEIKAQFGDTRRTEIIESEEDLGIEDLIAPTDLVVTLSHEGYVKTQKVSDYEAQRRGGRGKSATSMKDEDFIEQLLIANTHDMILCFSSVGKLYWIKTYQLPQGSRISKGKPINNVLALSEGEKIQAILPVKTFSDDHFVVMATKQGTIKKVNLSHFSRPRQGGIIAIDLQDNDRLIGAALTDGKQHVMLFSNAGKVIRFEEAEVRATGRTSMGVRGISLQKDQEVIALQVVAAEGQILTATEFGYGKRTVLDEYRITGRGGMGVISIQVSERNGKVIGAVQVKDDEEMMLISDKGTMVRTRVSEVSSVGRNTQGVRLIRLSEGEKLIAIQKIVTEDAPVLTASTEDDASSITSALVGEEVSEL